MQSILEAINSETEHTPDMPLVNAEIQLIRALFFQLFAEAVVLTVPNEEEIWLVERGPTPRLFVWERTQ